MKVTVSYDFDVPEELLKKSIDEKMEKCIKDDPDIVKVVRCKDCKHRKVVNYKANDIVYERDIFCELDGGDPYNYGRDATNGDWFCADGERSEDREKSC